MLIAKTIAKFAITAEMASARLVETIGIVVDVFNKEVRLNYMWVRFMLSPSMVVYQLFMAVISGCPVPAVWDRGAAVDTAGEMIWKHR